MGEGDDALAVYAAKLELIAPPGARTSYSQAADSLAARVIEKVVGRVADLGCGSGEILTLRHLDAPLELGRFCV